MIAKKGMRWAAVLLVAGLLTCVAPPTSHAQASDPTRLAAAKSMMQAAGVAKQFEELMPLLAQQISQSFIAIAPDKAPQIRDVFGQMSVKFVERKDELIDQVAVLYAEQLTTEELNAIESFYHSPVGAKLISLQPQVARQSMAIGQRWGAQIGREIEEEARRELKKRGIEL